MADVTQHRSDRPESGPRVPPPISGGADGSLVVRLDRGSFAPTPDQALWTAIRYATNQISYNSYERALDAVMHGERSRKPDMLANAVNHTLATRGTPFPGVEPYRLLKVATEAFLTLYCGVEVDQSGGDGRQAGTSHGHHRDELAFPPSRADLQGDEREKFIDGEEARYYRTLTADEIFATWRRYGTDVRHGRAPDTDDRNASPVDYTIPYLAIVRRKLGDVRVLDGELPEGERKWLELSYGIIREKLTRPCFLELIWSYWHEEGMLVQTLNAIAQRFQNVRGASALGQLEISPLRPLSNLLWGYIQDEPFQLSVRRRLYEYDHHYGLSLYGKAVPELTAADTRSKFLEAFHNLFLLCTAFFKQDDDKTVVADGFPILNALKETHLILTEGQHNQYGDLPWTARMEMLIKQWILARPEFREFLPTRIMVAYPEPWMDRVDAMKRIQGWTDVSTLHFRNLGVFGEQLLLSIRFGAWSDVNDSLQGANWARYWRSEIQGYIHAYRAVTGVDVTDTSETMSRLRNVMPSVHLRNRLAGQGPALPGPEPAALPAAQAASSPAAQTAPARRPAAIPSRTGRGAP